MKQKLLLFLFFFANTVCSDASNLRLTNIEVENAQMFSVRFTIAWDNAWCNERNHDAAWVFLKFQPKDPEYNARPVLALPIGHEVLSKSSPAPTLEVSSDRIGFFIYPSSTHRGSVEWTLRLFFDPKSIGNFDLSQGAWNLYALEMVYVPEGGFTLGDPDTSALAAGAFFRAGAGGGYDGLFEIKTENQEIAIGSQPGNLNYRASEPEYQGDRQGILPPEFPKGVQAFYIQKYELSQGEYAAFLQSLGEEVTPTRANFAGKGYYKSRGSISFDGKKYEAKSPARPLNFVGWDDGCAFADWAGLRPMTELEFEKACRGSAKPISHEFPWGTDSKKQLARFVDTDDELKCAPGLDEGQLNDRNREVFGASHFWVMDLAGSVWEKVVSVGHPGGRAFRGTHGDGKLMGYGFATNEDWPRGDHNPIAGFGYRGGGYYEHGKPPGDFNPHSPIGWRNFAAWSGGPRSIAYGFRCVRTANRSENQGYHHIQTVKDFIAARQRKDEAAYLKMVSPKMRIWYEEKKGEGRPWNPKSAWTAWDEFFNGQKTYGEFREDSNAVTVIVTETNDFFALIERPPSPVQLTWWLDKEGKIEGYLVKSLSGNAVPDRLQEFEAWAKKHDPTELAYLMPDGRISPEADRPQRWKKILLHWRETLASANNPEAQIRKATATFSQHLMAGDWDAVAAAYTEDAKIFPPGQPVVQGRADIRAAWAASSKITFHKITPSEIKIIGSEAWDWGVYEGKSVDKEGKESVWKGKYVIVWKEAARGDWKMYLDIWNRMPD